MKTKFKAMVLSCIDPRFQPFVFNFLKKKKLSGKYSLFNIAGAAVGVTHKKFKKWHPTFFDNLKSSIVLHKIQKLIIMNHIDCGAVKIAISKEKINFSNEFKIHKESFFILKKIIKKKFPKLKTEFYLITLEKKIIKFDKI
tara:strand:- start:685 stop:1107 length:423 start_codon:yes stop_codon:yes gene_type:complete